jgi:hypothetical protein
MLAGLLTIVAIVVSLPGWVMLLWRRFSLSKSGQL